MIFPYGQNALILGFPIAIIFSLITLVVFNLAGYPYLLLPLIIAAFFDVGPAAVLANATGGRRGVVIASIVGGGFVDRFSGAIPAFCDEYGGRVH